MVGLAVRRITNELKNFHHNLPDGIYIDYAEDDVMQLEALLRGPSQTPYENTFFKFKITVLPTYPYQPPKVKFISSYGKRIHPNLYENTHGDSESNGKVCLSILGTWKGEKWSAALTIQAVLITIQALLHDKPITCEPGYEGASSETIRKYNELKQYECLFILSQMVNDESNLKFRKIIVDYVMENKEWYMKHISSLCDKYDGKTLGDNDLHCPKTVANYKNVHKVIDEMKRWPVDPVDSVIEQVPVEPVVEQEPAEPVVDQAPVEPIVEQVPVEPVVEHAPVEPIVEQVQVEPIVEQVPVEPIVEQVPVEPIVDQVDN